MLRGHKLGRPVRVHDVTSSVKLAPELLIHSENLLQLSHLLVKLRLPLKDQFRPGLANPAPLPFTPVLNHGLRVPRVVGGIAFLALRPGRATSGGRVRLQDAQGHHHQGWDRGVAARDLRTADAAERAFVHVARCLWGFLVPFEGGLFVVPRLDGDGQLLRRSWSVAILVRV